MEGEQHMIPKEVIDEILARADIKQVISPYVRLQRAGNIMKGLCPFHSEKTPSFTVYPQDNSFYCFGCGVGGSTISFIQKAENLSYPEAVEYLAKQVGITIPDAPDKYGLKPKFDKKRIYEMNVAAARFFHANLLANTPEAKEAFAYLHEKRGLSTATINHFGLGYAPREYGATSRYLKSLGYTEEEMIAGFLCGKNADTGRVYDTFYDRVMFPIIDPAGNIIAFGGRVMQSGVPNKYKNSSDTPVFSKRRNLFALNFAKDACGESMILCEGYMDVISMHEAGFTNAVATLGTAITPEQARLMKRYTKSIVIAYDMDEAGRHAADKAMVLLEEVGLDVRLLKLENAKDPDEYIKKFGRDKFQAALDASASKFDYNLNKILSKYVLSDPQDKIDAANELAKMIAQVSSAAERDVYTRVAAKALGMEAAVVKNDVERAASKREKDGKRKEVQSVKQASLGFSDTVNRDFVKMPAVARAEEAVLGLLLLRPGEYLPKVKADSSILSEDDFLTEFNRRVYSAIIATEDGEIDYEAFTPEETGRIVKMKIDRMNMTDNGAEIFLECCKKLKESVKKQRQKSSAMTPEDLQKLLDGKRTKTKTKTEKGE